MNGRIYFFSSRRRHTRYWRDWSSDVCSSDLGVAVDVALLESLERDDFGTEVQLRLHVVAGGLESLGVEDRKSVVQGKSVDLGGRRIIKKKRRQYVPVHLISPPPTSPLTHATP